MKDIEIKINAFRSLQNELDNYIWSVFFKYREIEKITFSGPDKWYVEEDGLNICFEGEDGCMGCYDHMSIRIPMKFFINPDVEFKALKEDKKQKAKEEKDRKRKCTEAKERALLKTLQKKYSTL
jgi:hypothetical protein